MFYFTSCLVLLIGLNQMAVFSSRRLHKGLQKRSTIILSSSLLFIVSLLGGMCTSEVVFLFVTMENIDTCFPTCESAEVYVDSFFSVVSAIACIFFVIAVLNLRRKRQNVVSSVTKSMLESAKMSIFRQSCFILFCSTEKLLRFALVSPQVEARGSAVGGGTDGGLHPIPGSWFGSLTHVNNAFHPYGCDLLED